MREAIRRFRALPPFRKFAVLVFLGAAIAYGGSKSATVIYGDHFTGASSSIDDETPHIVEFWWRIQGLVPPDAKAVLYATAKNDLAEDPMAEPVAVTNVPMSDLYLSATMPTHATNYYYGLVCEYESGPAVVTNGVYHIPCSDAVTNKFVPIGVTMELKGAE